MISVTNLIIKEKSGNAVFVFPSEAAAASRRKEFLDVTGKRAVKNSRFLSWDRFKEQITLHDRADKPVNSLLRRLFAADIIRRNSEKQLFTTLIPVEYRHHAQAFTETVYRVLPELEQLIRSIQNGPGVLNPALTADYTALYHEYRNFMAANRLFEPSWELPELKKLGNDYYIICPEIIEDFSEYEILLKKAGCRFLHRTEAADTVAIRQFENSVIETDTVLNEISSLLSSGVHHSAIAVTAADESTAELLMSKAGLREIPVNRSSGKPLSEYPAGRLPGLIRSCWSSGFSITSMKELLLYRAFVWKESETAEDLIRFGIENRCLKNLSRMPSGDVWAARLKTVRISSREEAEWEVRKKMLDFYKKLRSSIEKITSAASFVELSRAFQIFVGTFLDTEVENWNSDCEQIFQRSREVLASLRETETQLEKIAVQDPLGIWIDILGEKIYVQQQSAEALTLFPYRVSALINPMYHFVIGLSHEASTVSSTLFPFLTDQQRRDIGAAENNMTNDFIAVYGESGGTVRFSCAAETPNGTALPPGFFISSGKIERPKSVEMGDDFFKDPVQAENRWWERACRAGFKIKEAGALPVLTKTQLAGFEYASSVYMSGKDFDAAEQCFPPGREVENIVAALSDDDGMFRASATLLNSWKECRFAMMLNYALGIGEDEYTLRPEDPWGAGNVMHDVFFDFFSSLNQTGEPFRLAGNSERYAELIKASVNRVFSDWESRKNYFFGPSWTALRRKIMAELSGFPEAEAEYYDGFTAERLEEWLEFILEEQRIRVFGKVDRISTGSEGSVIVDYKKSWKKKTRVKFISEDDKGELLPPLIGYQLPLYILLAGKNGVKVAASSYYSIAGGCHFPVSGDGGVLTDDDVERLCRLTLSEIIRMAEESRKGDFTAAERCDGCGFRAVCRKRFNLRWTNR
ncbi:MAG: PD-(D/E)XK nuclease family protein [Spirochaetales bacterium]|uniref:PD-(D/E)XK nuclease family protein n=1 Tax=Candidatus Thalassospirochaeta sargassi TaxID=3119039 RepID=A0AAJ1IC43_9SPIO|nr:PD-(D/E)XK nuclease family protein [Spirochaetales bacterium]